MQICVVLEKGVVTKNLVVLKYPLWTVDDYLKAC